MYVCIRVYTLSDKVQGKKRTKKLQLICTDFYNEEQQPRQPFRCIP